MPFNGSGAFNRVRNWVADAAAAIKIRADLHDSEDDGFAAGLSNCICKDGQTTVTADIPWNGKKLTNVAAPVNPADVAIKSYVDGVDALKAPLASPIFTGNVLVPTATPGGPGDTHAASTAFVFQNAITAIIDRYYTVNSTWNKPAGLKYLEGWVQAAGGGGGGAAATASNVMASSGGAGGPAGHFLYAAGSLLASHPIVIGGGGAAGTGTPGAFGGTGGTSSFNVQSAAGGAGGGNTANSAAPGGFPGPSGINTVSNCDEAFFGHPGHGCFKTGTGGFAFMPGCGGGGALSGGGAAAPGSFGAAGNTGQKGGGGSGCGSANAGGGAAGGAGGDGWVLVREYY